MKEGKSKADLVRKHICFIFFVVCLSLLVSCNQEKTGWKGTIEEKDGVTIVNNPKEPLYTEDLIILEEDLSIGKAEGEETYTFNRVFGMDVDEDGRIFVKTYERVDDKKSDFYFDVFDSEGKFMTRFSHWIKPHVWKKGNVYTIEKDDDDFPVVKRYKVTWNY
jgi:hypothetical protein